MADDKMADDKNGGRQKGGFSGAWRGWPIKPDLIARSRLRPWSIWEIRVGIQMPLQQQLRQQTKRNAARSSWSTRAPGPSSEGSEPSRQQSSLVFAFLLFVSGGVATFTTWAHGVSRDGSRGRRVEPTINPMRLGGIPETRTSRQQLEVACLDWQFF